MGEKKLKIKSGTAACKVDSTFPYAKGALVWAGNGSVRELELCMHAAATCVDFHPSSV
jgi:hypothetical protein